MQNQLISDPIVFNAGGGWSQLYFTEGTGMLQEGQTINPHGEFHKVTVNGFNPKDSQGKAIEFSDMEGRQFICKVTDGNGYVLLVGNLQEPLIFEADNETTQSTSGRSGSPFRFKGSQQLPSPFYTAVDEGTSSSSSSGSSSGSSSSGVFNPTDIATLIHWSNMDAANLTKDGSDRVSQVNDLSGNGNHWTQGVGANQPLWVEAELNGEDVIRLNGIDEFMIGNWLTSVMGGEDTPFTVVCVVKVTNTGNHSVIGVGNSGSNDKWVLTRLRTGAPGTYSLTRIDDAGAGAGVNVGTWSVNTWYVVSFRFDGSNVQMWENQVSEGSGNSDIGTITVTHGRLGVLERLTQKQWFLGDMAELFVLNEAASTSDRQALEDFVNDKYNIF